MSVIQGYKDVWHDARVSAEETGTDDTKYAIGCQLEERANSAMCYYTGSLSSEATRAC